jgi:hypothetical protein
MKSALILSINSCNWYTDCINGCSNFFLGNCAKAKSTGKNRSCSMESQSSVFYKSILEKADFTIFAAFACDLHLDELSLA